MNFGSILGSISPAFGIASGQGAGAMLGNLSPALMLAKGLAGHGHGQGAGAVPDPAASVQPPAPANVMAPPQPLDHMDGPSVGTVAAGLPQMAHQPDPNAAGGMHGVAFGGKPNMQGILAGLQMLAPGGRRF